MKSRKALIDNQFVGLHSASEVESGLHMTDSDCLMREKYDIELDFHYSIALNGKSREGIM